MTKLKNLLCLILSLVLLISLTACVEQKPQKDNPSSDISSTPTDVDDNLESDDTSSDSDENDSEDLFIDDESADNQGPGLYYSAEITLKNGSTPIQKDFLGFNAIYHAYTFRNDNLDRVHNDRSAKAELDAVKKSGISVARTYFDYKSAWDNHKKEWNFESEDMQAFYLWCSELQNRDIQVHLSYWSAFSELFDKYLSFDDTSNIYKEGSKPDAFYVDGDETKTLDNFATFIDNLLKTFKAKGLNNATYLSLSTEPGFVYRENDKLTADQTAEIAATEFLKYSNAVHNKLKASGMRESVTIVGPNEGAGTTPPGYMAKAVSRMDTLGAVDLYSSHNYNRPGDMLGDGYTFWNEDIKLKLDGIKGGADKYVYDEYGIILRDNNEAMTARKTNPFFGTQLALQQVASLNNGIRGSYLWTLMDQQWPNNTTVNTDGFVDGVHNHGILPNFQINNIPHPGFYAFQLMANFIGQSGAEVYDVDYSKAEYSSVYATMVKLPNGDLGIAVVNANQLAANVKLNFEKSLGVTLYRHEYDPIKVSPTADAEIIPPSAKITNAGKTFCDVVPALGLIVYTTSSPAK